MAVVLTTAIHRFIGLSSDTKPTGQAAGSSFFETDTGDDYLFDGTNWVLRRIRVDYADSQNLDAFGRLRVANPLTLFESKQIFDNQPQFWDESLESGADITSAHSADTASTVITSTLNTAGKFTRQTFMRFNYQPGKSSEIFMTGVLAETGGGTGVQRRIGIFDDENGIFFEDDEGTTKVVLRSNATGTPVDDKVAQDDWNVSSVDGTGGDPDNVDWAKAQLFVIDFEWLAVGRVRLGLILHGQIHYLHAFDSANVLAVVYMSTPNLPLRYQMITTGSSPASTMECICATVASEAGRSDLGTVRYKSTEGTHVDATTENTIYAVLGIRLKATHLGATVTPLGMSLIEMVGSKNIEWILLFNPTVAGTFTYGDETNSAVQTATGATANTVTGGTQVAGGHFKSPGGAAKGGDAASDLDSARHLGAAIDGTVDELVLAVRPIGGSSAIDIEGSLEWREVP